MINKLSWNYSVIITSCLAFSDVLRPSITLLEKNCSFFAGKTMIISDGNMKFENNLNLEFFDGNSLTWTERLLKALLMLDEEYVLFLLDDYLIDSKVSQTKLDELVCEMKQSNTDFIKIHDKPRRAVGKKYSENLRYLNNNIMYSVNTRPGLWKRETLISILEWIGPTDIWDFEVKLTLYANDFPFSGKVAKKSVLPFIDGVIKGKITPKSKKVLYKTQQYNSQRSCMSDWSFLKYNLSKFIAEYSPRFLVKLVRKIYIKKGKRIYSNEVREINKNIK